MATLKKCTEVLLSSRLPGVLAFDYVLAVCLRCGCACCVSACVLQAKQNTELVGRSIFLRMTRAGRVENSGEGSGNAEAASDAGADMDSTGTEAALLDKTDLVLMGECGQLLLGRAAGWPGFATARVIL